MFADGDKGDRDKKQGDGTDLGCLEGVCQSENISGLIVELSSRTAIVPVLGHKEEFRKIEEGLHGDICNSLSISIDCGEEVDERIEVNDVEVIVSASIVSDESE